MGRLAGLLLLVAVISAGMPSGEIHAHADGGEAHDHAGQLAGVPSGMDTAPEPADPVDPAVLHAHDVATTVPALPTFPVVTLDTPVPLAPGACLATPPPPSSARTPPHRPPIA